MRGEGLGFGLGLLRFGQADRGWGLGGCRIKAALGNYLSGRASQAALCRDWAVSFHSPWRQYRGLNNATRVLGPTIL